MKKYIILVLFMTITLTAFTCDMAAAISFHNNVVFHSDESSIGRHYCTQLVECLNECPRTCGMGQIFYDYASTDGISHNREENNSIDLDLDDYDDYIPTSNIMFAHARYGTTGGTKPYHPFVWESRTDNKTYTFMANGTVEKDTMIVMLEEGANGDWLDDAIIHLHSNSHNETISSESEICDSEYYFYWLIKNIEANRDILEGIEQAVYRMNARTGIGTSAWKNFVLSDGESLYLYRNGTGSGHNIYWGEVEIDIYGTIYPQDAFAVTTTNIGTDYNHESSSTTYTSLSNEVDNYELVVLHSDGDTESYQNIGNLSYFPEVSYNMIDGINWKCFPVDWSGYDADEQIEEIETYFVNFQTLDGSPDNLNWFELGSFDLTFDEGYKVEIDYSGREVVYALEGCHVLEDYEIDLDSNETRFWLPYFIHGSKSPYDAFSDIIDYAIKIQGKYWTMSRRRTTDSWTVAIDPGQSLMCYYGKMYDVTLVSGHPTSMDYDNIIVTESLAEYVPPETEYYTYEEGTEYEAVLIDTIISNDPIEEIAVFENGECIGASVFLGYPVFIRAFTTALNRSHEPLEFRIYTGERSDSDMDYRVYDEDFSLYRDEEMYPRESIITRVCLGEKGEEMPVMDSDKIHSKQYPDPFNPETSIEYSIPEQGKVTIDVYNIKGQKVRSLLSANQTSGIHKVIWNGSDDNGKRSATGMYFYILKYKDQTVKEKMLMIK